MSKTWPNARLGEVLKPVERPEAPVVGTSYRQLGVKLWGEGAYERESIDGAATKYSTLSRVEADDIVVNKIWARNGSVAIVQPQLAGCFVSGEFPTFVSNPDKLMPRWIHWLTKTAHFWAQCDEKSQGTSGKNRIKPDQFLNVEIPLPPLTEQRRIVQRIEELAAKSDEARTLRHQAVEEADALTLHLAGDLFPEPSGEVVGDHIRFQTGYAFNSEWFSNEGIRLARNANVGHGRLDWSETVRIPFERRAEFRRFELNEGDVLVSLDRPIISTGVKVAQVTNEDLPALLLQRVARAQFRGDTVLPGYFFRWLRSPHLINAIDPGRSNGVPHISHKDIEKIPFTLPPLSDQRRVVAELDALQAQVDALKHLQAETAAELHALLPSVLDRAFAGDL
ncbi:MAG: restriction endonuclease subunit S [Planctomycetota bacterium]